MHSTIRFSSGKRPRCEESHPLVHSGLVEQLLYGGGRTKLAMGASGGEEEFSSFRGDEVEEQ
jgi:hypothetical protein